MPTSRVIKKMVMKTLTAPLNRWAGKNTLHHPCRVAPIEGLPRSVQGKRHCSTFGNFWQLCRSFCIPRAPPIEKGGCNACLNSCPKPCPPFQFQTLPNCNTSWLANTTITTPDSTPGVAHISGGDAVWVASKVLLNTKPKQHHPPPKITPHAHIKVFGTS